MKRFVLGIIVGALLFGSAVFATDTLNITLNPFPVLIDNEPATVEGYNIDGYTFLKLADFKKAKLGVSFNQTENRIEITTTGDFQPITFMGMKAFGRNDDIYISAKDLVLNKETVMNDLLKVTQKVDPIYKAQVHDGMRAIQVNGIWYVEAHETHIRIDSNTTYSDDGYTTTFATQDGAKQVSFDRRDSNHAIKNNLTWYYNYDMLFEIFDYVDKNPEVRINYQEKKESPAQIVEPDQGEPLVIETYKKDDIEITKINGVEYVNRGFLRRYMGEKYEYRYSISNAPKIHLYDTKTSKTHFYDNIELIIFFIDDRPQEFIKYDFYINELVPLLTE